MSSLSPSVDSVARVNPFVGPRAIAYGEPIYGRSKETADLLSSLIAQRILLLYSPSGAGKSSLIEAGLRPQLERRDFRVLPTIRVGLENPDDSDDNVRNRYLLSTLLALEEGLPDEDRMSRVDLTGISLAEYLDRAPVVGTPDRDPCLVFDQFEELFTLDPTDTAAKRDFLAELGIALRNRGRWAMFSMREDFIAQLDPFLDLIPNRFSARYRLDLLEPEAALAAMQRPAADSGVDFTDEAARLLIDDLRVVRVQRLAGTALELGPYVEAVQLQVVCRQLWATLGADATAIERSDVRALGNVDRALADFYDTCVRDVAMTTGVKEVEIRRWVHEELITQSGFRMQALEGPGRQGPAVLRGLENTHLLRAERHRGATWYELAHDRLVEPIRASNAPFVERPWSKKAFALLLASTVMFFVVGFIAGGIGIRSPNKRKQAVILIITGAAMLALGFIIASGSDT